MCLSIDREANQKPPTRIKIGYKILLVEGEGNYKSIYLLKKYKLGVNTSNRKQIGITKQEQKSSLVYKGIHLYKRKNVALAMSSILGYHGKRIVVRCYCHPEDFVSYGRHEEMVYRKVTIKSWKPVV